MQAEHQFNKVHSKSKIRESDSQEEYRIGKRNKKLNKSRRVNNRRTSVMLNSVYTRRRLPNGQFQVRVTSDFKKTNLAQPEAIRRKARRRGAQKLRQMGVVPKQELNQPPQDPSQGQAIPRHFASQPLSSLQLPEDQNRLFQSNFSLPLQFQKSPNLLMAQQASGSEYPVLQMRQQVLDANPFLAEHPQLIQPMMCHMYQHIQRRSNQTEHLQHQQWSSCGVEGQWLLTNEQQMPAKEPKSPTVKQQEPIEPSQESLNSILLRRMSPQMRQRLMNAYPFVRQYQ